MHIVRYRDGDDVRIGLHSPADGMIRHLPNVNALAELWRLRLTELRELLAVPPTPPIPLEQVRLLAPVDGSTEVWACGVTYEISREARMEESERAATVYEQVYDAAWMTRDGRPVLLLATRRALRRLDLTGDQGSTNIEGLLKGQDGPEDDNGFFAVATARHALGVPFVALAAREKRGVLVSLEGGEAGSFQLLPGSAGKDVRVLAFQRESGRTFLWAGMAAEAGAEGAVLSFPDEAAMRELARAHL